MSRTRPRNSALRQPLSYALGTPAKVAALRALSGAAAPLTQRDVARRAGVQHRSIQLALDDLVALALVARIEGGRDFLVHLNRQHRLASPVQALFTAEAEHFLAVRRRLGDAARALSRRAKVVSVAIFGSAARGQDSPQSDCDLLVIARDQSGVGVALDALASEADALMETLGCRIQPIGYTRSDAAKRWRARTAPFNDIARDAIVVFGPPLAEVLHGPD